jgi:ATP-dependent Clp protease, protease subunit
MQNQPVPKTVYATFSGNINQESLTRIFNNLGGATQQRVKTVHLLFESNGGVVSQGVALFNYLNTFPLDLHIYNVGGVSSAAVIAFLGAPHRYASARANFMIHLTRTVLPAPNDAATHRAVVANLEADDARTEAILRERANIPEDRLTARLTHDVTITAQEALAFGIIHEIREFHPPKDSQVYNI